MNFATADHHLCIYECSRITIMTSHPYNYDITPVMDMKQSLSMFMCHLIGDVILYIKLF